MTANPVTNISTGVQVQRHSGTGVHTGDNIRHIDRVLLPDLASHNKALYLYFQKKKKMLFLPFSSTKET